MKKIQASKYGSDLHQSYSYGSGVTNPMGLKIPSSYQPENQTVEFDYEILKWQEGAPGYVHGGIIAAILDEAQGNICIHLGNIVVTKRLDIQYHLAIPSLSTIKVKSWITKKHEKTIETEAIITNAKGRMLVNSNAQWYILPDRIAKRRFSQINHNKLPFFEIIDLNRSRADTNPKL